MMFSVFCPTHDSKILMTRRNALSFWNGPDGPVIQWRCNCGQEGFLDRNGSHPIEAPVEGAVENPVEAPADQRRRLVA